MYSLSLCILIALAFLILVLALITFRKYFTVKKNVEIYEDKMIMEGEEPSTIRFSDIKEYEYFSYNQQRITIRLLDKRRYTFSATALIKDNSLLIAALKSQIELLIESGKLPMTRKFLWPFLESKWISGALMLYTAAVFFAIRGSHHLSFETKTIILFAALFGFVAWVVLITVILTNRSRVLYKRNRTV